MGSTQGTVLRGLAGDGGRGPFDSVELPGRSSTRRNNQDFQGKNGGGLSGGHMRTPSINDSKLTTQRCTSGWSPSVPARSHCGMAKVRRTLAAAASREDDKQGPGEEGVDHSVGRRFIFWKKKQDEKEISLEVSVVQFIHLHV